MNSINAHNWFFSVKRHVKGISQNFSDIIFHYQDQWKLTVNDFPCPLDDGGCKGLDFQETYVMPAFKRDGYLFQFSLRMVQRELLYD